MYCRFSALKHILLSVFVFETIYKQSIDWNQNVVVYAYAYLHKDRSVLSYCEELLVIGEVKGVVIKLHVEGNIGCRVYKEIIRSSISVNWTVLVLAVRAVELKSEN